MSMLRAAVLLLVPTIGILPACAVLEDTDASEAAASDSPLLGVWRVAGKDERGSFTGELELRPSKESGKVDVIRVVRYESNVKVEGDRELWTAWTGSGTVTGAAAKVSIELARADFVKSRGGITRTEDDRKPLTVSGEIRTIANDTRVRWSADGLAVIDTLEERAPIGNAPIFAVERSSTPVNEPPGFITKAIFEKLCSDYGAVPLVAPYANDPRFKAGITYLDVDRTDLAFYRKHPNALRAVNKVVDAPSLGETLLRADAYGKTLAQKAAYFDEETPRLFLEPATAQVVDGRVRGVQIPTWDGALWTATYIASQAYRYWVTKDPIAVQNIARSAAGQQLLLEIVPDDRKFARTLRASTGKQERNWHEGVGAFSGTEWLENGNNDMYKGLFYGNLMAFASLCDPVIPGQEALCQRMQRNVERMKRLDIAGDSGSDNHLMASWLAYYVNGTDGEAAADDFLRQAFSIEQRGFQMSEGATADWSGTHLTFVKFNGLRFLAAKKPLDDPRTGGRLAAERSLDKGVKKMADDFGRFRMGIWSVLFSTPAIVGTPEKGDVEAMRGRLEEAPAPRGSLDIDHRVSGSFCMSPYPSLPWKGDCQVNDRTDSLHGFPLFEQPLNVYNWRSSPYDYKGDRSGSESPSFDYLHAYWLARYLGVIRPGE